MTDQEDLPAARRGRPMQIIRRRMVERILATVGTPPSYDEYRYPAGDPGLFGANSVAWIVHGDLPSMLIGGISSLMLQTLNPGAMAGVAEHSNYREDPLGRLHRTARFVAGTTYGPNALADQLIETVKAVHKFVVGTTDDGRPYSAGDPDLLTWVHITEVSSFLRSYLKFGKITLTRADQDRYFSEVSILAERLGATTVPKSVDEVAAYFEKMQPELRLTPNATAAVEFLRTPGSNEKLQQLAHNVVVAESIAMLPDFARELLHLRVLPVVGRPAATIGARVFSRVIRWAMGPSRIADLARERASAA